MIGPDPQRCNACGKILPSAFAAQIHVRHECPKSKDKALEHYSAMAAQAAAHDSRRAVSEPGAAS